MPLACTCLVARTCVLSSSKPLAVSQPQCCSLTSCALQDTTVPISGGASVTLPSEADLAGVLGGLATVASSSVTGMFPANLFPGLNATRFGFAPTDDSFCLFHVPKAGGKTPTIPAAAYVAPGAYGYSSGTGEACCEQGSSVILRSL